MCNLPAVFHVVIRGAAGSFMLTRQQYAHLSCCLLPSRHDICSDQCSYVHKASACNLPISCVAHCSSGKQMSFDQHC